jgi:putative membrane protein (TIGR04086 family)
MKNWFNKNQKYLILSGILVLITLILSIIYLFSKINYPVISNLLIIIFLLFIGLLSYLHSQNKNSKGWLMGMKTGLIIILILFILSIIIKHLPSFNQLIYYLLILLASIWGAILGKNIRN